MAEQGSGLVDPETQVGGDSLRRYTALVLGLGVVTLLEWVLYYRRVGLGLGRDPLVAVYLASSCLKFAATVAWFMRFGLSVGWRKKSFAVALVLSGGMLLALRLLLVSAS